MSKKKKWCGGCSKWKTRSTKNWYKNKTMKDGLNTQCTTCYIDRALMSLYGITKADYDKMVKRQKGKCCICKDITNQDVTREKLSVDHCHKTGVVRGLLCPKCNKGLGLFSDCIKKFKSAIKYLEGVGK